MDDRSYFPGNRANSFAAATNEIMEYRYPWRALLPDYLRALAGLVLMMGLLTLFKPAPAMVYVCLGIGVVFLAFGLRTARRHLTKVEVTDDGIRLRGSVRATLSWKDLGVMTVTYYSTRRDHSIGWMELRIRGIERADVGQVGKNEGTEKDNHGPRIEEFGKSDKSPSGQGGRFGGHLARRTIRLDSGIEGFSEIVLRAARAAIGNRIDLDSATRENLLAMGIDTAKLSATASRR